MAVTKDTKVGDALQIDRGVSYVLMQCGMYCITCPASYSETLEEACYVHGLDPDAVCGYVNEYLAQTQTEQA